MTTKNIAANPCGVGEAFQSGHKYSNGFEFVYKLWAAPFLSENRLPENPNAKCAKLARGCQMDLKADTINL